MFESGLVLPDDALLVNTFGSGAPSRRAYRARLRRAEAAGILPRRVYLSAQRFAYVRHELEDAMKRLPRQHAEAIERRSVVD